MTWEQKLMAMQAICHGVHPVIRNPGDWYLAMPSVELKKGNGLTSAGENGTCPEDVVEKTWVRLTEGMGVHFDAIVIDAMSPDKRRHVRWNGYMWENMAAE